MAQLSLISLIIYFAFRIYIYSSQSFGTVNIFFAIILLLAEGHSILQSFGFLLSIIRLDSSDANRYRRKKLDKDNLPEVTILVPARNEPLQILKATFICLSSLNYTNKTIFFLDGSDPKFYRKNGELAEKYHIHHFIPEHPSKNKAEIINKILPQITSKYISVFDADQNPMPQFLTETVGIAEFSENIAFVQTPQLYTNIDTGNIAKSAALQQSIFFENICEGKGASNAMFCCGTNYLMRTHVLKEVGGFDESSVTEDFSTSVSIHALGYRSIYYNHVRVFGMAPQTLSAYFKQQNRWSAGTIGAVKKLVYLSLRGKLHLYPIQLWEYFLSATYYLTGWSFLALMLCPAFFLLFRD